MDTDDPLYEIDLTDPPEPRQSSRRQALGLLAGTALAGLAGSLVTRPSHPLRLTVDLLSSSTEHRKTSDVTQTVLDASPWTARSPDGATLAVSDTSQVVLWTMRSGKADPATGRTLPATLSRFTFVFDDVLAVAQTGDATIQFWTTGRVPAVVQTYTGPVGRAVSLTAGPHGTLTLVQTVDDRSTTQLLRITRS